MCVNICFKKNSLKLICSVTGYFVLLTSMVLISSCDVSLIRRYEGPVKPDNNIAKLFHKSQVGWRISSIDNKALVNGFTTWNGSASVDEIHLLPGKHEIRGDLVLGNKQAFFNVSFDFEAGKKYQLSYKLLDEVVDNRVVISIQKYKKTPVEDLYTDIVDEY